MVVGYHYFRKPPNGDDTIWLFFPNSWKHQLENDVGIFLWKSFEYQKSSIWIQVPSLGGISSLLGIESIIIAWIVEYLHFAWVCLAVDFLSLYHGKPPWKTTIWENNYCPLFPSIKQAIEESGLILGYLSMKFIIKCENIP